jgi:hypothetical protein
MNQIIDFVHEGPTDAAVDLRSKLAPIRKAGAMLEAVAGVDDPLGEFVAEIMRLLRSPIANIVDMIWTDHDDVQAAIRRTRSEPGQSENVRLMHERVTITDTLLVKVNGVPVKWSELELRLTLTLDVRSLIVRVADGGVIGIGPLEADVTAKLTIGDDCELLSGTSRTLALDDVVFTEPFDHGRRPALAGHEIAST